MALFPIAGSKLIRDWNLYTPLKPIFLAMLLFSIAQLTLSTNESNAQELDKKATCIPTSLLLSFLHGPRDYTIKAKQLPPSRILNPGDTYQILYEILTPTCSASCHYVKRHNLAHRAVLGADRSRLAEAGTLTTSVVQRHECGGAFSRVLTFTVPEIALLGNSQDAVVPVSMGVCPPSRKFNCAGHTIRVRNAAVPHFSVSAPKALQRALGGGPGTVTAGTPVKLRVSVNGDQSVQRWPQAGLKLELRQSGGNRINLPPAQSYAGDAGRRDYQFNLPILRAGNYVLNACITGLKDGNWPAPDICSPNMRLTVIGELARPTPQPGVGSENCTGGRFKSADGRCRCPPGSVWNPNEGFERCYTCRAGTTWNPDRRRCVRN